MNNRGCKEPHHHAAGNHFVHSGRAFSNRGSVKRLASVLMLTSTLGGTAAYAQLPTGGNVTAGSGTISADSTNMTINQSSNTLAVDWNSFSVGSGNSVKFVQPSSSASVLNRVLGNDVSVIQGRISANGQVFLVNQRGVLFAPGAQVDVGGLVASTLDIKTTDFLSGNYTFTGNGGAVTNQGTINAAGGLVALIAAKISNTGSIRADGGSVLMGAGSQVLLDLGGPVKLQVQQSAIDALIENGGAIRANGGTVLLTASAADNLAASVINNTGLIEAQTLSTGQQGSIQLLGGRSAIQVGGTLDASAPSGGDGGAIETSARVVNISDDMVVDTSALAGQFGAWTLDPDVIQIVSGSTGSVSSLPSDGTSQIGTTTLNNALRSADVKLQADQLIDFKTDFTYSGSRGADLDLYAPTIRLGGDIKATNAKLDLQFGGTYQVGSPGHGGSSTPYDGNLYVDGGARKITTNGGDLTLNGDVGGGQDLTISTGSGSFTNKSAIDGTFNVTKSRTDDLLLSFNLGGDSHHNNDSSVVLDFSAGTLKVDSHSTNYSGSLPSGTVNFDAGTVLHLDAKSRTSVTLTLAGGGTKTLSVSNGNVTIPSGGLAVTKISYTTDGSGTTRISASDITYNVTAQAGKLDDLVVKTGTLNLAHTIAVSGSTDLVASRIVNSAGAHPLTVGQGQTWRIWSTNSDPYNRYSGDQLDGLDYDYKQYNATYGSTTPAGTGDGLMLTYAPVLTVTVTGSVEKTYDGNSDASLSSYNYQVSGAVGGDSVTVNKPGSGTYSSNGHAVSDAGSRLDVTVSGISVTSAKNGAVKVYGYQVNSQAVGRDVGTIDRRPITLTADSASKTYGDSDPNLSVSVSTRYGDGLANGDSLSSVTGRLTRESGSNVGRYDIRLGDGDEACNYIITFDSRNNAFTINARPITLIASAASKTYGDRDPTLGVSVSGVDGRGLAHGDSLYEVTGRITRQSGEDAGDYNIKLGHGSEASNYAITFDTNNKAFTIDPRVIVLIADAASKTYGDADPTLGVSVSGDEGRGLAHGDTLADVAGTVTRQSGENAGSYSLQLGTGEKAGNYTITFDTSNKAFTIDPRLITLIADSAGKTYGDVDPTLGVSVSGVDGRGLGNGDTVADVAGTITRQSGETVGSYSLQLGSGGKAGNYTITFDASNKAFTIDPRLITLIADRASKIYGDADPTLGASVSGVDGRGLANGDTVADVAGTITRQSGESLGNYNLRLGNGGKVGNYTINFNSQNQAFTIGAANINTQQFLPRTDTTPQFINPNNGGTPPGTPGAGGLNYQAVDNAGAVGQGGADGGQDSGSQEPGAIAPTGSVTNPLNVLVVDGGVNTSNGN